MTLLAGLTDDEVADGICLRAGRLAAGEADFLRWVAEFDRREAWGGPGLLSMAHWLSWRVGLSPGAARERVRVARALEELPLVRAAFGAGRVSYSQVRAVTRVATPDDEQRWVELARCTTAGQLEKAVRGVRRARRAEVPAVDPERASWLVRARKRYDEDGNAVYTIVLPAEQSVVLDAGLEAVRAQLDAEREQAVRAAAPAAGAEAGVDVSAGTASPQDPAAPAQDVSAGTPCPQDGAPQVADVSAETGSAQGGVVPGRATVLSGPVSGDLDAGPTASRRATVAEAFVALAERALEEQSPATARTYAGAAERAGRPAVGLGQVAGR